MDQPQATAPAPPTGAAAVRQAFANSARSDAETEAANGPKRATISSDFETFLRMLTVQMENQDPLDPVDSADYAVQLATFSSVEQQVLTNDLLTGLGELLGGNGLTQVAAWVGRQAQVTVPVQAGADALTVVAETVTYADRAMLHVKNAAGEVLASEPVAPPGGEIAWSPEPGSAAALEPVTFEVESFSAGTSLGAVPAPVYAPVREVRMADGVPVIVVPGGATVPASEVSALREP